MYAATTKVVVEYTIVITVILLIQSAPLIALFDSGRTYTFIAKTFVDRIGVIVEDLGYDLAVSTLGHTIGVCVRGVAIFIH